MIQLRRALLACVFWLPLAVAANADEGEIRAAIKAYSEAFNEKQWEQAVAFWAEDATYTDRQTGEKTSGREAIAADLKIAFEQRPDARLAGTVESVDLITANVAQVQGETALSTLDSEPEVFAFSSIMVKQDGKWLIHSIEEMTTAVPASAYDALSELDWMIGEWRDQSEDSAVISTLRWSPNQVFLIRSTAIQAGDAIEQQGTQIIGWDPRSLQIRSWTFNSDGSFGDAVWSKSGKDWLIKSSQTLEDGQAASGTFVISPVDDESLTVRLIGHEIEGEPQPASDPIEMMRVVKPMVDEGASDRPQGAVQGVVR